MTYNGVCISEYGDPDLPPNKDCCLVEDSMVVFTFWIDGSSTMELATMPWRVEGDGSYGDVLVEKVIPKEYT